MHRLNENKLIKDFDKFGNFISWGNCRIKLDKFSVVVVNDETEQEYLPEIYEYIDGIRIDLQIATGRIEYSIVKEIFECVEKCIKIQIKE